MRRLAATVSVLVVFAAGCTGRAAPKPTHSRAVPGVAVVYLRDDATAVQKKAIEAKLRAVPGAGRVRFVSREEAYRQFKKTVKDTSGPVGDIRPEDLPESYRVRVDDRTEASRALASVRRMPGVEGVHVLRSPSPTATP